MTQAVYKVDGMDCQGCVKAVTRSIKGAAPDADIIVELETGMVTVSGAVTDDDVEQAVRAAGFEFGGRQN